MNGAVELQSWTSSSSIGSTSSTFCIQLLACVTSGTRPPASIATPVPLRAGSAERAVSASSASARGVEVGVLGERRGQQRGVGAAGLAERDDLGLAAGRQRRALAVDEVRVGARGAAHGLGGVVDQDVERALLGDRVGERDDLAGVAQVDADDAQAVDPVRAVLHPAEAARRRRAGSAS